MSHMHIVTNEYMSAEKTAEHLAAEADESKALMGNDDQEIDRLMKLVSMLDRQHDYKYGHTHVWHMGILKGIECPDEGDNIVVTKEQLQDALTAWMQSVSWQWGKLVDGFGDVVEEGWIVEGEVRVITPYEIEEVMHILQFAGPFTVYYD